MGRENGSSEEGFILSGFSDRPLLEMAISVFVFFFYLLALLGNSIIILVSGLDSHLHTPMYFFLANLSLMDLFYTTSNIPQILLNVWGPEKTISFLGCMLQFYFAFSLGASESILLAIMAFDRFIAVCRPLYYPSIMHFMLYLRLVTLSWVVGFGVALLLFLLIVRLPRCGHRWLDNFFCEMPGLIGIACGDITSTKFTIYVLFVILVISPLTLILVSYGFITWAVLRIKSTARWGKAFNTCVSHMTVVTLYYGPILFRYSQPGNSDSGDQGKFLTLFYTVVTPTLNPLIYTLRNKDVKGALRRLVQKKHCSKQT
ncbi:putative olfactory receptor 2W6 [Tachyglossus aculeatus]|uniref:putative olfactory receptor 2W6 n=1 Tax=Tachyglossus aculeatus TaxID=9261 RepID=UPI0018F6F8BE|nr:putative olfactory receptor 2W6 [Tachyglossus aculeatus]